MIFKRFFKSKNEISPHQLGKFLYDAIQMGLSSQSDLSIDSLICSLGLAKDDLTLCYQSEVVFALMYQAIFAANKYESPIAEYIINGMTEEFLLHTKEMGATDEQLQSYLSVFFVRAKGYTDAEKNKALKGPAYWIGKHFLENLTGVKQDSHNPATEIKLLICSNFLTASLVGINAILQECKITDQN